MIDALNHTAFTAVGAPVTWAELAGFATGLASVWLAAIRHIANFPVGMTNVACFAVLFADARLYADAALQGVFFVLLVFGWWAWLRLGHDRTELTIRRASPRLLLGTAALVAVLAVGLVPILQEVRGSAPHLDALTAALSVGAQLLLSLKIRATWYVWIVADLIYIPLYVDRDLYLTAAVYAVFLAICVRALHTWPSMEVRPSASERACPVTA